MRTPEIPTNIMEVRVKANWEMKAGGTKGGEGPSLRKEFKGLLGRPPENKKVHIVKYDAFGEVLGMRVKIKSEIVTFALRNNASGSKEVKLKQDGSVIVKGKKGTATSMTKVAPTVAQIAILTAERGTPETITLEVIDKRFEGDEALKKSFDGQKKKIFPFDEIAVLVLKKARMLDPRYKEMSLEQIGEYLIRENFSSSGVFFEGGRMEMWRDNMGRGTKINDGDDGKTTAKKEKMTASLEVRREAGKWKVRQGNIMDRLEDHFVDARIVRGGVILVETAVKLSPRTKRDIFDMRTAK